jgi:hypothetical protein
VGVPTLSPCEEKDLGDEMGSEFTTGVQERCGVGLLCCRCRARSVRRWPNDQEQCVFGGRLLAFGRSAKMRRLIR